MKILHISSVKVDYPGGTEKVIWEIARRQARSNEVTILQTNLYQEKEPFKREEIREKIRIVTCKNDYFLGGFGYSSEFKGKLKEIYKDFDVVHIHGHGRFTSNFAMGFLDGKKPFVYSAQGFFHNKKNNFFKKMYDFLFRRRLRKASFCTALTELERVKLVSLGVDERKTEVIPGGINLKRFNVKINRDKLRSKYLGKRKNKKTLLYVGRIHESKGIQHVIDAIEGLDVNFLIVGRDAGFEDSLKKRAKERKVGGKVKFLGGVTDEELFKLYKISDLFVLYSDWEGFGLVVIEAMAGGLPVIGSDKGALPLLIKNDFNGYIAHNEEELMDKIKILTGDEKLRSRLSRNSLAFAKDFDWDNISVEHFKLYKTALRDFHEK